MSARNSLRHCASARVHFLTVTTGYSEQSNWRLHCINLHALHALRGFPCIRIPDGRLRARHRVEDIFTMKRRRRKGAVRAWVQRDTEKASGGQEQGGRQGKPRKSYGVMWDGEVLEKFRADRRCRPRWSQQRIADRSDKRPPCPTTTATVMIESNSDGYPNLCKLRSFRDNALLAELNHLMAREWWNRDGYLFLVGGKWKVCAIRNRAC